MVPTLREALIETDAHLRRRPQPRPQEGETDGLPVPPTTSGSCSTTRPTCPSAPSSSTPREVTDLAELEGLAGKCGARLRLADVARDDGSPRHDPEKLAAAYAEILAASC